MRSADGEKYFGSFAAGLHNEVARFIWNAVVLVDTMRRYCGDAHKSHGVIRAAAEYGRSPILNALMLMREIGQ